MKIQEIINNNYDKLHHIIPYPYISLYDGYTYEDILHNVLVTAINKFKNKDIEEDIAFDYIRKTLLMEIKFTKNRKKLDKIVLTEGNIDIPINNEDED